MDQLVQYLVGVAVPVTLMALVAIGRWVRTTMRQLEDVHALATSVDAAVNHRPESDPKIYDLVKDANEQASRNGEASARLEEQFAEHSRSDEVNFADLRSRLAVMPQTGRPESQA